MKKLLFILLAAALSVSAWAAGNNSGKDQLNAIDFDWEGRNTLTPGYMAANGLDSVWYRVSLTPLYDQDVPVLALYIINNEHEAVNVTMYASLAGQKESRQYTIAGKSNMIWSKEAGILVRMNQKSVDICLKTNRSIDISAKVYESEDADESCIGATVIDWNTANTVWGGKDYWRVLDISELQADTIDEGDTYEFRYEEILLTYTGPLNTLLTSKISPDCPSSGLTGETLDTERRGEATHTISYATLSSLNTDQLYLCIHPELSASEKVLVTATKVQKVKKLVRPVPPGTPRPLSFYETLTATGDTIKPVHASMNTLYENIDNVNGLSMYVTLDEIKNKKLTPEIRFINDSNLYSTNVKMYISYMLNDTVPPMGTDSVVKNIYVPSSESSTYMFEKNMIDALNPAKVKYIVFKIIPEGVESIMAEGRMKNPHEGDKCSRAVAMDWKHDTYQEAGEVWYAIDLKEAREGLKDIDLKIVNRGNSPATVHAEVAFTCPYDERDLESITRAVGTGDTLQKVLPYSLYASIGADVVYVGVSTDQPIKICGAFPDVVINEADTICLQAIPFDWTYGHLQTVDTAVWYAVDLVNYKKELKADTSLVPVITIQNMGSMATTIYGEVSMECPDSIPNMTRELSLGAGESYEREISREMLKTSQDVIYLKITTAQPISFQLTTIKKDLGVTCKSAKLFNWVSGETVPTNEATWYKIALREARQSLKDVKITFRNNSSSDCQMTASLAPNCPCDVPQVQSRTLSGNAFIEKTLVNSMLSSLGDTIWIKLEGTQEMYIKAELVEPEYFEPIYACGEAESLYAHYLAKDTIQVGAEPSHWYLLKKEELKSILDETEDYAPQVVIRNKESISKEITLEVAYHCPVTQTMQSYNVTIGANDSISKFIERSMADAYTQDEAADSILIRITGSNLEMEFKTIDPNKGNDCLHATAISSNNCYEMEAGEEYWYKIRIKELTASPKTIKLGVKNHADATCTMQADIFANCEASTPLQSAVRALAAKDSVGRELGSDLLYGLGDSIAYIRVLADKRTKLCVEIEDAEPLLEPDTLCQFATQININKTYPHTVEAGKTDTVWYAVNLSTLRLDTDGNDTILLKNTGSTATTFLTAMAYECPVLYPLTDRNYDVAAGQTGTIILTRENILSIEKDMVYIRIIAEQSFEYSHIVTQTTGTSCTKPISFNWNTCSTHPAGETYFYKIPLRKPANIDGKDTTECIVPSDMDMRIYIQNQSAEQSDIYVSIASDCGNKAQNFGELNKTIDGYAIQTKDIDGAFVNEYGDLPSILLMLYSSQDILICADLIENQVGQKDTIRVDTTFCVGETLIDMYYHLEEGEDESHREHEIKADDASTWTWSYSWSTADESSAMMMDSTVIFTVHPITAPKSFLAAGVKAPAQFILQEGLIPNGDSLATWISNYYLEQAAGQDTVAKIDPSSCLWLVRDAGEGDFARLNEYEDFIDGLGELKQIVRTADTKFVDLVFAAGTEKCQEWGDTLFNIQIQKIHHRDSLENGFASVNKELTWRGHTFTVTKDTTVYDTVRNLTADTVIYKQTMSMLYDSIYIYKVRAQKLATLYTMTEVKEDIADVDDEIDMPKVLCDTKIAIDEDLTAAIKEHLNGDFEAPEYAPVDKVWWERYDTLENYSGKAQFIALDDHAAYVNGGDTVVSLAYVVRFETGDTLYSSLFNYELKDCQPNVKALNVRICDGETYAFGCPVEYFDKDTVLQKTFTSVITETDSIVELHLSVLKSKDIDTTMNICYNGSVNFADSIKLDNVIANLDTTGVIAYYGTECDSVHYTLHIRVTAAPTTIAKDTILGYGKTYMWHDTILVKETKMYYDTAYYTTGCDSVWYTLNALVLPEAKTLPTKDTLLCYNEPLTWKDHEDITILLNKDSIYRDTTLNCLKEDSLYHSLSVKYLPKAVDAPKKDTLLCYGESFKWHDTILISEQKMYYDTLFNQLGCDSVYYSFDVAYLPKAVDAPAEDTILGYGKTYSWHDTILVKETGIYNDTLLNQLGCDSVYYLLNALVLPAAKTMPAEDTLLCYNETLTWKDHEDIAILLNKDSIYRDTTLNCLKEDSLYFTLSVKYRKEVYTAEAIDSTICYDSYIDWGENKHITTSGTYYKTLPYAGTECDSVIVPLNLTIQAKNVVEITMDLCEDEKFDWGNTHILNVKPGMDDGKYTKTEIDQYGCDSTTIVTLTVHPTLYNTEVLHLCKGEAYRWNNYGWLNTTTPGEYMKFIVDTVSSAVTGCDSIIELSYIVHETEFKDTTYLCEGERFEWGGNVINDVNKERDHNKVFTTTFEGAYCDSIVTMTLKVAQATKAELTENACGSFTWTDGDGKTHTTSGDYTWKTVNAAGCDSIVTLHLTMNKQTETTLDPASAYVGDNWTWNNVNISSVQLTDAGEYTYITENAAGCDSIVHITLVVLTPTIATATTIRDTVCAGSTYVGRVSTQVINDYTKWTDSVRVTVNEVRTDSFYTYEVWTYDMTVAEYDLEDLHIICGAAIDFSKAEEKIEELIAQNPLFPTEYEIVWKSRMVGSMEYSQLDNSIAIPGSIKTYEVGYIIRTECGETELVATSKIVEMPNSDNTTEYDIKSFRIIPDYNYRLLLIDLDGFTALFHYTPKPEEITWYRVEGELDNLADPDPADTPDVVVGHGMYYSSVDGASLRGNYYARVVNVGDIIPNDNECTPIIRTTVIQCLQDGMIQKMPALHPSVANAGEPIVVTNLHPYFEATINVYDVQGNLINSTTVNGQDNAVMEAAPRAGFYTVEVLADDKQFALKYIVR